MLDFDHYRAPEAPSDAETIAAAHEDDRREQQAPRDAADGIFGLPVHEQRLARDLMANFRHAMHGPRPGNTSTFEAEHEPEGDNPPTEGRAGAPAPDVPAQCGSPDAANAG